MKRRFGSVHTWGSVQRFSITLLLFCVGQPRTILSAETYSQTPAGTEHFHFTRVNSGRYIKPGGVEGSFSHYRAADGVVVERSVETYKSKLSAQAGLDRLMKRALRVVQTGIKADANGREIGKRVQLVFRNKKEGREDAVIAWVDGNRLFKLTSQSSQHIADFEQQDYPASLPKTRPSALTTRP
jgi:hypothetical protein